MVAGDFQSAGNLRRFAVVADQFRGMGSYIEQSHSLAPVFRQHGSVAGCDGFKNRFVYRKMRAVDGADQIAVLLSGKRNQMRVGLNGGGQHLARIVKSRLIVHHKILRQAPARTMRSSCNWMCIARSMERLMSRCSISRGRPVPFARGCWRRAPSGRPSRRPPSRSASPPWLRLLPRPPESIPMPPADPRSGSSTIPREGIDAVSEHPQPLVFELRDDAAGSRAARIQSRGDD